MPRNLTTQEKKDAKFIWPNMNVNATLVTDEATDVYNCLAWTLGKTDRWVWPWTGRLATKSEFDALYRANGFQPTSQGTIAAFGKSLSQMTHGSIFSFPYNKWESKCGKWLRIIHSLPEMEGGAEYGDVRGYYSQVALIANSIIEPMEKKFNKSNSISKAELSSLSKAIAITDNKLKKEFDVRYASWKKSCEHPLIMVSSNPYECTKTTEFLNIILLGRNIIPLLIEKIVKEKDFFSLYIFERLAENTFIIHREIDDPLILLGEQARAIETAKRWIQYNL